MTSVSAPTRPICTDEFDLVRSRLLGIAYRMLGNRTEAEDIVQDAWLRWQSYDRTSVLNPTAFLVTTTTRLAINAAQSARCRHERYVGDWVVEPVDPTADPALGHERSEILEQGLTVLLERLTPVERAAYILRQAFDYPYSRIAGILRLTEANTRQVVSRAGRRVAMAERHRPVDDAARVELIEAFVSAARGGHVAALERLFAAEVVPTAAREVERAA